MVMNKERNVFKMMVRFSLFSGALILMFWIAYYFLAGNMPVSEDLGFTLLPTMLSGEIYRWVDFLIGPIWSIIGVLIFTNFPEEKQSTNTFVDVIGGFSIMIGAAMIFAYLIEPVFSNFYTENFEVIKSLGGLMAVAGFFAGASSKRNKFGMMAILVCLYFISLVSALIFGLFSGLELLSFIGVGTLVGWLLKSLFTFRFWKNTWKWLTASQ